MYSGALGLPGAPNYQSMPVVFGCDLKTSGLYDSQNSGVFGLNYQPASMYSQVSFEKIAMLLLVPLCLKPVQSLGRREYCTIEACISCVMQLPARIHLQTRLLGVSSPSFSLPF